MSYYTFYVSFFCNRPGSINTYLNFSIWEQHALNTDTNISLPNQNTCTYIYFMQKDSKYTFSHSSTVVILFNNKTLLCLHVHYLNIRVLLWFVSGGKTSAHMPEPVKIYKTHIPHDYEINSHKLNLCHTMICPKEMLTFYGKTYAYINKKIIPLALLMAAISSVLTQLFSFQSLSVSVSH